MAALDHLVINTRFELDAAAALFAALGFTLTPRGVHTLGSINHLMVFPSGYLELIGLPTDGGRLRQEVLDSPLGIDGLVLQSADAEATHAALQAEGFGVQVVQRFSRPVEIDGREQLARFVTVRLQPGQFAAGRVYFCQHETPELVWRPEWTSHPGGITGLHQLTVVSAHPETCRVRLTQLGTLDDDFRLEVLDEAALRARFGDLVVASERPERFAAMTLRCVDPDQMAARAAALALPCQTGSGRTVIGLAALDTLLEFIP